jgi:pimeloyl-ACP methyl ester carboxylesterase
MPIGLDSSGSGRPLVLIHGLATTRLIWRRVVPILSRQRRVVTIDVPGFGTSPPTGPGFVLADVADQIDDELAAAGVDESYDLAGHSMGGALALVLASRRPERVRRVVLCAPAGLRPVHRRAAATLASVAEHLIVARRVAAPLSDLAWGRRLLMLAGAVDGAQIPSAEVRAMMRASHGAARIGDALAAVAAADLRPLLRVLEPPLGAVWGVHDRVVPARTADVMRALRPDAPVVLVERAGHVAMMERPHEFTQALNAAFTGAAQVAATL